MVKRNKIGTLRDAQTSLSHEKGHGKSARKVAPKVIRKRKYEIYHILNPHEIGILKINALTEDGNFVVLQDGVHVSVRSIKIYLNEVGIEKRRRKTLDELEQTTGRTSFVGKSPRMSLQQYNLIVEAAKVYKDMQYPN